VLLPSTETEPTIAASPDGSHAPATRSGGRWRPAPRAPRTAGANTEPDGDVLAGGRPIRRRYHPHIQHEQVDTTQIYLHADLALKERALARTTPLNGTPGRYRPPDALLAFLEAL